MALLDVIDVHFYYPSKVALQGITFHVERGEFVGIAGLNGSGKTTLLNLIHGIVRPSHGEILLEGRTLSSFSKREVARKIATVRQIRRSDFDFTAEEMVLLGRTPHLNWIKSVSAADRAICKQAMRRTDCETLADRALSTLSAGEFQRINIASALAQEPQILLLDEPNSFLDLKQQARLSRLLDQLIQNRFTIICASHDLRFLKEHAHKILLLDGGRQLGFGEFATVLNPEVLSNVFEL